MKLKILGLVALAFITFFGTRAALGRKASPPLRLHLTPIGKMAVEDAEVIQIGRFFLVSGVPSFFGHDPDWVFTLRDIDDEIVYEVNLGEAEDETPLMETVPIPPFLNPGPYMAEVSLANRDDMRATMRGPVSVQ